MTDATSRLLLCVTCAALGCARPSPPASTTTPASDARRSFPAAPAPATPPEGSSGGPAARPRLAEGARPAPPRTAGERGGPASSPSVNAPPPVSTASLDGLHQPCPEAGCAAGQTCLRWCGIAGCRPGSVFHTCEIPCRGGAPCPARLACVTIADGPGQVCQELPGRGAPSPAPPPAGTDR